MAQSNEERIGLARAAVAAYVAAQRRMPGNEGYGEEPLEEQVEDLLADLRHLCAAEGLDFDGRVLMSAEHFGEEEGEEAKR